MSVHEGSGWPVKSSRAKSIFLVGSAVAAGVLFVLLANAHLVYVAVKSQPDCVPHVKASERAPGGNSFSAAGSAC